MLKILILTLGTGNHSRVSVKLSRIFSIPGRRFFTRISQKADGLLRCEKFISVSLAFSLKLIQSYKGFTDILHFSSNWGVLVPYLSACRYLDIKYLMNIDLTIGESERKLDLYVSQILQYTKQWSL